MKALLGLPSPPIAAVIAAVLIVAAFLLLRPRGSSLILGSWPQPLWLYAQAIAAASKKPPKGKARTGTPGGRAIQVVLSRPVHFHAPRLRSYIALAGFSDGTQGAVPLMYPVVEGFRLVMQCMLMPAFPFNVLGAVLGRTRLVALRRLGAEEKLMYSARVDPSFRTTAKGDTEVDLVLEAHSLGPGVGGPGAGAGAAGAGAGYQLVWRSVTTAIILTGRRGGGGGAERRPQEQGAAAAAAAGDKAPAGPTDPSKQAEGATTTATPGEKGEAAPKVIDTWRLGPDTGRRYGMLNGDLNPIHLYPPTSRLFGFRRPIAHALYLTGRAEASLRNAGLELRYPVTLAADFKRPTLLPATLRCAWLPPAGGTAQPQPHPASDPAGALAAPGGARFAVLTEDLGKEVLVGWVSCHPEDVRGALPKEA